MSVESACKSAWPCIERLRTDARGAAVVLLAMTVLALAGCATRAVREPGILPLRVGISLQLPPFAFGAENDPMGLEVDFARSVSAALYRRLELVTLEEDELVPALLARQIDVIMSGLVVDPTLAEEVLFTQPYLRVGQLALIRRADLARLGTPAAMRRPRTRIGYQRGTRGETYVAEFLPRSESYGFETVDEGIRNLRAGRVDVVIHDATTVWRIALSPGEEALMGLFHPLTEEDLAWAVRHDDIELKRSLDALLAGWRSQRRLAPMLDRWIPLRVKLD